jgi:cytochrome c553
LSRLVRRLLCSALALAAGASAAQPTPLPTGVQYAGRPAQHRSLLADPASPAAARSDDQSVVTAPAAGPTDQSIARGAIAYVFFCADCHGANGHGSSASGIPQLAGLRAADLMRQLSALSTSAPNQHARLLARLDHQDLIAIADYLASFAPPPPSAVQ